MPHDARKRTEILKSALASITQEKQKIELTREDIEAGTSKFIDYTNLDIKSEEIKEELAGILIKQHDSYVLEPDNPY